MVLCWFCWFFFFKQKTAYEMRISDWSSDVCSSDLIAMNKLEYVSCRNFLGGAGLTVMSLLVGSPRVSAHAQGGDAFRSEERRVGKECVSTCRSRWSP